VGAFKCKLSSIEPQLDAAIRLNIENTIDNNKSKFRNLPAQKNATYTWDPIVYFNFGMFFSYIRSITDQKSTTSNCPQLQDFKLFP